ncbi:MAG: hypothetical protein BWY45_02192 [Euryarchaeota archaeon ADurb.Bin294]|nr:MAG: hypothetical protein BWY45_02192 [Euryarchaeota archaeon ADurb.Bin294]
MGNSHMNDLIAECPDGFRLWFELIRQCQDDPVQVFSFGEGLPDGHSGWGETDRSDFVRVGQECPIVKLLVEEDLQDWSR